MSRKSKEERIIDHGEDVLKELHKVYLEGIGIDEYYKLLKEYKRLYRRYEKTIKLSDNMGNEIMEQNDTLNDNLQYTIKTARSKLLENVSEHRKTKDAYLEYSERIKKYDDALTESYNSNSKLQKRLNSYIKLYGEINHTFSEKISSEKNSEESVIDVNPPEYKNMDIRKVVSLELSKCKENMVLSKIRLNNFNNMLETIEESSSIKNFIQGVYKYIKNSLHKDDIVFHYELETFYIFTTDKNLNLIKGLMDKLNRKRMVFNFSINFSIGITMFINGKDTKDTLIKRCETAFDETSESNLIVIK